MRKEAQKLRRAVNSASGNIHQMPATLKSAKENHRNHREGIRRNNSKHIRKWPRAKSVT
jgi:hypothetical protein